ATVTSPRHALHHRLMNSGVVHARYTRCRGASNSRVIRICVSLGRVTTADCLAVAAIVVLLLFEFLEYRVHRVKALLPRALVSLDPVMDGLERRAVEAIEPAAPVVAHVHRTDLAQDAQVL